MFCDRSFMIMLIFWDNFDDFDIDFYDCPVETGCFAAAACFEKDIIK